MSYGVWPKYAFLRKILRKNLDWKSWRWRTYSKCSKYSKWRDKLENAIKIYVPNLCLMGVWPKYVFLRKILKKNLDKKAWRWRMSNSPSWAQRRNVNQLFQIISIGVWPNYELLRELLKKNINEKAWRWRMSSKSSRHSGVRIRRDKLRNVKISIFSKQYLMGSDLTTRFTAFLRKILRKNLDEKS